VEINVDKIKFSKSFSTVSISPVQFLFKRKYLKYVYFLDKLKNEEIREMNELLIGYDVIIRDKSESYEN
jgi:hypothetical protein